MVAPENVSASEAVPPNAGFGHGGCSLGASAAAGRKPCSAAYFSLASLIRSAIF
jgi:hypothetical protein